MKNIFFLSVVVISLSSCNFYKPAMINAPVLEKQGELNLGLSVGNGTDVNASYAITDHVAASARLTSNRNIKAITSEGSRDETIIGKNRNYEAAIGYFNSKEGSFNYNFFAGYSAGQTGTNHTKYKEKFYGLPYDNYLSNTFRHAKFTSFFVQGACFLNPESDVYIGIVAKISGLEFDNFTRSTQLGFDYIIDNYYPSNTSQIVGQAGVQYSYKGDKFGFTSQFQYAFTNSNDSYFTMRKWGVHVGAYFRLNEIFKKNN